MKLIYIMDAYCGWCYGNSENLQRLTEHYEGQLELEILPAGMWSGENARRQTPQLARFIKSHDEQVAARTGTAFSAVYFHTLNDTDRILDSEVPARAIVATQDKWPALALDFTAAVQHARFVEGKDLNNEDTYRNIAEKLGIPVDTFLEHFHSNEMKMLTLQTFAEASAYAHSYPTLLLQKENMLYTIENGYSAFPQLVDAIDKRLHEAFDIHLN
ncbi:DsbA family protein [Chitinophaga vietnamensis]|uniref:DsbA family protein n=1 Tax=Chitinophaga vietnamensis TaxID=2593957 RepID=UPI00191C5EBE|nr:DsbA family protein [Chitinophaga vietnamensis]